MAEDIVVRVRELHKSYRNSPAVDGLDLDIRRGEVFALLGPNGAGKTTIVEILEGHRRRDRGEVRVLGEDPQSAGAHWRARIGIVLQSVGAFEELRVEEVVRHFARFYPDPEDPLEVIDRVGLSDKRRARARTLSGGQRRRLAVALGIVGRPELLFLDEPTTGFDPAARRDFWAVVRGLSAGGTTVLLTTHYLEEAAVLASRVGVLVAGRLVEVGPPDDLGGRLEGAATVNWRDGTGVQSVLTRTPTALIRQLAAEHDEIPGLTVSRATLDEVYLQLTTEDIHASAR
jgi:ABC-2 type transport system ATP-binding protein